MALDLSGYTEMRLKPRPSALKTPSPSSTMELTQHIANPRLDMQISTFRDLFLYSALLAPGSKAAASRFSVEYLHLQKHVSSVRHEFLSMQVLDASDPSSPHPIFLERTVSEKQTPDFKAFFRHPFSSELYKSILKAIQEHPPPVATPETIPMHDYICPSSSAPLLAPSHSPSQAGTAPSSAPRLPRSHLFLVEAATLASIRILHTCSSSLVKSGNNLANDRVVGVGMIDPGQNIRQIQPRELSLFELVLLASVVHDLSPLYSLFKNQCYWFSSIIFHAVEALYCSGRVEEPETEEEIYIPLLNDSYLPDLSGVWMGIRISRVEGAMVTYVCTEFKKLLRERMAQIQKRDQDAVELQHRLQDAQQAQHDRQMLAQKLQDAEEKLRLLEQELAELKEDQAA